jgi:hypothetical protein
MTPLNSVKVVFQNIVLKCSKGGFLTYFHLLISNSVKLILSVRGTQFCIYSVQYAFKLKASNFVRHFALSSDDIARYSTFLERRLAAEQ